MSADKQTSLTRNSLTGKTDADRASGGTYANQGGGKLGSGNENSGCPANDVLISQDQSGTNKAASGTKENKDTGNHDGKDTKGSGMPIRSGTGQLADDRPGRNDPKGEH